MRDARPDHDVGGPARRCQKDEEQTERFVVDLDARQNNDADCREGECPRVSFGARGQCRHGDRPDELNCHTLAEVETINGEIEGVVHEGGRNAKKCRATQLLSAEASVAS